MLFGIVLALGALTAGGIEPHDTDATRNLALGKRCTFAPTPNYSLTARGDTDPQDLTDGALSSREDSRLWFDAKAVGWSYAGLAQLAVDLGEVQPIDEVAIRFQGGSPQAGICIPGWVNVLVSDDGEAYYRMASYSKWRPGDKGKYAVPRNEGEAWVHRLRFRDLGARGRFVGLSFYCSGLTVADELYVFRGAPGPAAVGFDRGDLTDFTVTAPKLYFHKPVVYFSTNIRRAAVPARLARGHIAAHLAPARSHSDRARAGPEAPHDLAGLVEPHRHAGVAGCIGGFPEHRHQHRQHVLALDEGR